MCTPRARGTSHRLDFPEGKTVAHAPPGAGIVNLRRPAGVRWNRPEARGNHSARRNRRCYSRSWCCWPQLHGRNLASTPAAGRLPRRPPSSPRPSNRVGPPAVPQAGRDSLIRRPSTTGGRPRGTVFKPSSRNSERGRCRRTDSSEDAIGGEHRGACAGSRSGEPGPRARGTARPCSAAPVTGTGRSA